jgi:ATP-dependent helicase/nuclease subunit A
MPENEIEFTSAQRDAIRAEGGSLLVCAAAGSGKTRVLVERTVRMMTDPVHPVRADSLLIMTFTNAAAAKLRADIAERLGLEVRRHPGNLELRRQQMRLQRAAIGTVDAFCLHFVQQHFSAFPNRTLPPDLETGGDADLFRIRTDTLSAVLEDAYADPDFRAFADLYDRGRTDDTAGTAVLTLYDFLRTLPHPKNYLETFCAAWHSNAAPEKTEWGKTLLRAALERLAGARGFLDAALCTAAKDPAAAAAYTAVLQADDARLAAAGRALRAGTWDAAFAALHADEKWQTPGRIKGGREANPAAAAAAALRDRAKKQAAAVRELLLCTETEFREDRRRAAPLIDALARAVQDFSERFFAAKLEEKLLDYADYEHLTLELLQNPDGTRTELCKTVCANYSAVLVDEYQDTNALQDAIYFSLAKPDASNLFFVGDIKQSIYRFRQADPAVFIEKQSAWHPYPQGWPATVALDANFRSAPGVIDGINEIFSAIFSTGLGGVEYGAGQRLIVGDEKQTYHGLCELDAVADADAAGDAAVVAQRIVQMQQEGFAVRDGQSIRPCRWDDFCILLRSRADFELYTEALRAKQIPVYADTASDLLDAAHVRPFAALLRVIDNPAQDIELTAVLLSPMFPFTPDDLIALRNACPKGSLYGAVLHSTDEKFRVFCGQLESFRRLARTLPVDALMEELLARTGYLAAVGAMADGERCRDDLRAFTVWAAGAGRAGLPALVRAMEAARQSGGLTQPGSGQVRPGCVAIMTVHRSKGLEFPIVFVSDTARHFNLSDSTKPLLYHRTLGIGLTLRAAGRALRYKTMPYAALAQTIRTENLSEEMRVLYVALTRAKDALILTVPLKNPESELKLPALCAVSGQMGPQALRDCGSWAGWLLAAALRCPGSAELWQYTSFLPHCPGTDALTVRVIPAPAAEEKAAVCASAVPDAALERAILDNFAWHSPDRALEKIPAKVSVSEITHAARDAVLQRPAFLQKSGMTGAERGTAIHAFLQAMPFADGEPDLTAEVERQKRERLLEPELAEKLDLVVVQKFIGSAVWRRIRQAKTVLREEPFITSLPAREVAPAADSDAGVLVQGIADLVLTFADHAEIVDYKTDRAADPAFYQKEYGAQLRLYRRAFAMRLPVPVTKLTIFSFALGDEVNIPLNGPLRAEE